MQSGNAAAGRCGRNIPYSTKEPNKNVDEERERKFQDCLEKNGVKKIEWLLQSCRKGKRTQPLFNNHVGSQGQLIF